MLSVVTMANVCRLMIVVLLISTAVWFVGCRDGQPRVVKETDDQTFEEIANLAAEETERSEAEEQ